MCSTKFSILIKFSGQKRYIGNSYMFIPLYLHRFHHFILFFENLGTERTGGIIKLVVVVDMVLNFLITDIRYPKLTFPLCPICFQKVNTNSDFFLKLVYHQKCSNSHIVTALREKKNHCHTYSLCLRKKCLLS